MRGGTPLGALDIYIAPPPLEAWGAVIIEEVGLYVAHLLLATCGRGPGKAW